MTDLLEDLKNTILDLIEDLKDNVFTKREEQGDLELIEFYFKRLHPKRLMELIIKKVLPHKSVIDKRDMIFFEKEKDILFGGLAKDKVDHYSSIITKGNRLTHKDRELIWDYFDSIILLSESYQT